MHHAALVFTHLQMSASTAEISKSLSSVLSRRRLFFRISVLGVLTVCLFPVFLLYCTKVMSRIKDKAKDTVHQLSRALKLSRLFSRNSNSKEHAQSSTCTCEWQWASILPILA